MKRFLEKYEWLPAALLLLAGCVLRLIWLDALPYGLNQDEASAGYDAWALLRWGVDRCGNSWPLLLESWGSGQNALYSYLCIPFMALLGPTVLALRLPMALAGCGTLFVFWRLARRIRGRLFGLCALLVLALCPWHIMASRWALESNLLPLLLLLGVFFTVKARLDSFRNLWWAALCFGLSLYAYGTAFFFLPLFLICAVVWLRQSISLHKGCFFGAMALFFVIAAPIAVCQLLNALDYGEVVVLGVTIPDLTATRQSATTALGGSPGDLWRNFVTFIKMCFTQTDGLPYNSAPRGGMFYFFGSALALLGLVVSLARRKDFEGEAALRLALLAAAVAALIISPNINRMNMAWLPIIYFSAEGLYAVCRRLGAFGEAPILLLLLCFGIFWGSYVRDFGRENGGNIYYYPGLGECIEYCAENGAESVYISDYVNQPYIYALFYTAAPADEFLDTVDYTDVSAAFRTVRSFGPFRFGPDGEAQGEYLILHWSEAQDRQALARFGRYVVCAGQ